MDEDMELALEILRATDDGDKLAPLDLKLVEMAVNKLLNERGIEKYRELHRLVVAGEYAAIQEAR